MPSRRSRRLKLPHDVDAKLQALETARHAMTSMNGVIIINSDLYRASEELIAAIDKVAEELTGKKNYFTPMQNY